jgi:hypothetical protein
MKKRYVVLVEEATKAQDDAFLSWVREEKIGWWHWMSSAWLLSDSKGRFSAGEIRNKLKETHGTATTLVLELRNGGDTWAGYGPKRGEKSMFDWIKKAWRPD